MSETSTYDLIVVGGGPAGSSLAALVAAQGHKVLLLELARFPRHQIGESLLPYTVHGICRLLGVTEDLERARFVYKRGTHFRWGRSEEIWTVTFGKHPLLAKHGLTYAYQVERSKFDEILLNNARRKGADVREGHKVTDLVIEDGRVAGAEIEGAEGKKQRARARFVADASGNTSRIATTIGKRVYSEFFRNTALYGYYRGGKRLPHPKEGDILIAAFGEGWFWYIPLSDEMTSVGVVMSREMASQLNQDHEGAMRRFIDSCPLIRDMLAPATRITEGVYGELRLRRDWSYINTKFWSPGVVLVGDAACFVDPIFSSGVHLGTYGALLAARSINTCLRGGGAIDEERCFVEFERRYRREYSNWYQFVLGFYDLHQDKESYYFNARKILSTEEQANDAFIRLCSGVSNTGEPLYESACEFMKDRSWSADAIDMIINEGKVDAHLPMVREKLDAEKQKKLPGPILESGISMITQSLLGAQALPQAPLYADGLIASEDGFHWVSPS